MIYVEMAVRFFWTAIFSLIYLYNCCYIYIFKMLFQLFEITFAHPLIIRSK